MSLLGQFLRAASAHFRDQRARQDVLHRYASPRTRSGPRRRPPAAGMPVPAVPPRGPLPMQGGAEAPLEFGAD